jgi:hypothetical protein
MLGWCLGTAVIVAFAALEWFRFFVPRSPSPIAMTVIALGAIAFATFRIRALLAEATRLRMARDGERIVAEMLQHLVAAGWRVFHDVAATGFNIDHIAVGPAGILAIETKTRSKPNGRNATIRVDDSGIKVGGRHIGWAPVEQAQRQAAWLARQLQQGTSRSFAVQPVVLFPGWYIEDNRRRKEPWVLSCAELPRWVKRARTQLDAETIAVASDYLDRYVRSGAR